MVDRLGKPRRGTAAAPAADYSSRSRYEPSSLQLTAFPIIMAHVRLPEQRSRWVSGGEVEQKSN